MGDYSGVLASVGVGFYDAEQVYPQWLAGTRDKFTTSYTNSKGEKLENQTSTEGSHNNKKYFNEQYDFYGTLAAGKEDGEKKVLYVSASGCGYVEGFVYEWKKGESTVEIPEPIDVITPKNDPNRGVVTPYENFADKAPSKHNPNEYAWVLTEVYLPEVNVSSSEGYDFGHEWVYGAGGGRTYETFTAGGGNTLHYRSACEIEEIPRYFYPDKQTSITINTYYMRTDKMTGSPATTWGNNFAKEFQIREYPANGDLSEPFNPNEPFLCKDTDKRLFTQNPDSEKYWGYGTSGKETGDWSASLEYGKTEYNKEYVDTYEFVGSIIAGKPGDKIIMVGPKVSDSVAEVYVYQWKKGTSDVEFNEPIDFPEGYKTFIDYID